LANDLSEFRIVDRLIGRADNDHFGGMGFFVGEESCVEEVGGSN
jgi:hypothetical protein